MKVMFAGMLGGWEIVLILAVVLILFGAKRLPELAKGLGTGIKEFKKATREVTEEVYNAMDEAPAQQKRLPSNAPVQTPQVSVSETPQPQAVAPSTPGTTKP